MINTMKNSVMLVSVLVISVTAQSNNARSYRSSDRVVFPDEGHSREKKGIEKTCCGENEIPIELAMQLSQITDEDYFFKLLSEDSVDERVFSNSSSNNFSKRFGEDVERSPGVKPKPAGCNTETTIINLRPENDTDPTVIYYPGCTRVQRCSGCCYNKLLSCQPSTTRTIPFEVLLSQYVNGNKLKFKGKEVVLIEEHVTCACGCRIKEEHCDARRQKYNPKNCRCECKNIDDQHKCAQQSETKQWNPETCLCECRDVKDCTTGSYYDHNVCKCLQNNIYWNF